MVSAGGTPPLSYQWFFNGTNLPEPTAASLIVSNALLANGGGYSALVTNAYGWATSLWPLAVLPGNPVLSWPNPAALTYGAALTTNQLNAAANVAGSFAYNPTNGTVLNAGVNTLWVVFTPSDGADYNTATGNVSLVVLPAPLSVTASNATRVYGQTNPLFTGTISGLQNGDSISATYSTSATAGSPAADYAITPAMSDPNGRLANYSLATNNGTLTVTRASLVVTAAKATRVFGQPNPLFTGSLQGLVNGDAITATYGCGATPASPMGTYPIVPGLLDPDGKLVNYLTTLVNGTLTITAPPPLIRNGGFETGDFTGWTQSGNSQFTSVENGSLYAHSGSFGAQLGPSGSLGYLSQTVPTVPGVAYRLSLWLDCPDGATPGEFVVAWDGTNILDLANIPAVGWTNLQFTLEPSSANTLVQFGFRDDPSYLGLDDVVVEPIPRLRALTRTNESVVFTWNSQPGLVYQVQCTSNLGSTNWVNLGEPATATDVTTTTIDVLTNSQQFYRIILLR